MPQGVHSSMTRSFVRLDGPPRSAERIHKDRQKPIGSPAWLGARTGAHRGVTGRKQWLSEPSDYTTNTAAPATGATTTRTAPALTTATVVVASSDIPVGTLLTASNLKTKPVATDALSLLTAAGGADYPTIAPLTASKEYAASAIVAGLPILSSEVTATPAAAAAAGGGRAGAVPLG